MKAEKANAAWCEALYEQRAAGLILYGRALGLSHGESEDVLQDTFMALLALPSRPEEIERYCVRSFRNRALNFKRSLWRRVKRELESSRWFESSPQETPLERAAMKCLARLPVEQREVIVLKIWNEHTFESIAQLTGLSPHTVAGRYRYGMEKLRTCLKGHRDEPLESMGDHFALLDASPSVEPS